MVLVAVDQKTMKGSPQRSVSNHDVQVDLNLPSPSRRCSTLMLRRVVFTESHMPLDKRTVAAPPPPASHSIPSIRPEALLIKRHVSSRLVSPHGNVRFRGRQTRTHACIIKIDLCWLSSAERPLSPLPLHFFCFMLFLAPHLFEHTMAPPPSLILSDA